MVKNVTPRTLPGVQNSDVHILHILFFIPYLLSFSLSIIRTTRQYLRQMQQGRMPIAELRAETLGQVTEE